MLKLTQSHVEIMDINIEADYKNIIMFTVSFNHKYVAFYTNSGHVWMGLSDCSEKLCEIFSGYTDTPHNMTWILDSEGSGKAFGIVVTYNSLLLIIGLNGELCTYTYDEEIILIPEMDGLRLISNGCHEMLQNIPKPILNTFAINSQESSSFLFEAYKQFQQRSHKSDEYLTLAKCQIEKSVEDCINAACYDFDPSIQKSLMGAAYFGKSFIHKYNTDEYIQKSRFIRVLNALRQENIGIPITYIQFNHLKPDVVLDRLVFRKHYGLATQIAKHLKLSESGILRHWAFYKVINDTNDREIVTKVAEKLLNPLEQGVRYHEIAKKAIDCGRNDLAVMLLDLETNPMFQVPLLLRVGDNRRALTAATQSGNTDLVYTVLLKLKQNTPLADVLVSMEILIY